MLDGDPAPPPRKGAQQPPLFGPLLWPAGPHFIHNPYCRIGSARWVAVVAILPDNCHPSSFYMFVCKYYRQVEISANRTPLMTSESAANHGTLLYGYHDNRATYKENKRLFRGVYDERKLSVVHSAGRIDRVMMSQLSFLVVLTTTTTTTTTTRCRAVTLPRRKTR